MASPVALASTSAHLMQCMEIVGGNGVRRQQLSGTGVDIWVDSRPLGGQAGGDIHYFSHCGGGHMTRLVLADVAGHGMIVVEAARRLRKIMRKNINTLNQIRFAKALNEEFGEASDDGRFATALLATYFAPTEHLLLCNAGHPRPFWYRCDLGRWIPLDAEVADAESVRTSKARYNLERIANLPLGILAPTDYQQFAVKLGLGDLVLFYTDAWLEARNPEGALLGEAGFLEFLERVGPDHPRTLGERLTTALDGWRGHGAPEDDQTLVVIERVAGEVPSMTLGLATRSLLKILGILRV